MNTTVTITYANGSERKFIASDELEELIEKGEMFSVTTMHSDMGIDEELGLSKMHVGNPMSAMGHMMMMRRNAEKVMADESTEEKEKHEVELICQTLTTCIGFLSEELTSHQSSMIDPRDNELKLIENTGDDDGCS